MTGELNIKNMSDDALKYEFIVAFPLDGELWYWGAYRFSYDAESAARNAGGFVVHNVRVQGYAE